MHMLLIFLVAGAGIFAIGLALAWKTRRFIARATRASAQVAGTQTHNSVLSGGSSDYSQLSFEAADGKRYPVSSRLGLPGGAYRDGQVIGVLYDPADPHDAVIDRFIELHMPWLIFAGVGAGWILAAAVALVLR